MKKFGNIYCTLQNILVVQRIEHHSPKVRMQVRFLPGMRKQNIVTLTLLKSFDKMFM